MAAKNEYKEAVGRRKTATARVRVTDAKTPSMLVNGKTADEYFPLRSLVKIAHAPMQALGLSLSVSAHVRGGGHKAQAVAIRHAIARTLSERSPEMRKDLKHRGYLKRDPRAKERKKFGLKGARRAPQWSKR